jgi:chemotaxis protein CheX
MKMLNNPILQAITEQTVIFLVNEMKIELLSKDFEMIFPEEFESRHYTAIIVVGGKVNFMFIMSFENKLIDVLIKKFIYGDMYDKEIEEIRAGIACEVANTVIGMSIPNFPDKGAGITITPPNIIEDKKLIEKNSASLMNVVGIKTSVGNILIGIILSEEVASLKEGMDNA